MESKSVTLKDLLSGSSSCLLFIQSKGHDDLEEFVKKDSNYMRLMIGAMLDKSYDLISGLLTLVNESEYDYELMGYALFQGHINVVNSMIKEHKLNINDAILGEYTIEILQATKSIDHEDVKRLNASEDDTQVVDIALLSNAPSAIDYVAVNVRPLTSGDFLKAVKYKKLESVKYLHNDTLKKERVDEALRIATDDSWISGIEFLTSKR